VRVPDQAYILGEFIRYLEHPQSGALDFDDIGPRGCRSATPSLTASCASPTQVPPMSLDGSMLCPLAVLQLSTRLGTETTVYNRKELREPASWIVGHVATLADHGRLHGARRIPNRGQPD